MKIRFNKYEKVAGLFVGVALLVFIGAGVGVALKNGWFARRITYMTDLETADGVHAGTAVQIAGLRVGAVTDVELGADDHVRVHFQVLEKFRAKVREGSQIQMFRPFVLSDKVLEISTGTPSAEQLPADALIPTVAGSDVMDLLTGKKMMAALASFDHVADSLSVLGRAFGDKERTRGLVQMIDHLNPLVRNLNAMASEVVKVTSVANRDQRVETIVSNLALVSKELGRIVPALDSEAPNVGTQLGQIVTNLNVLTMEMKKLTPAVEVLAPELPRTSKRAVEALDETVVLLKALQKSFLLRGSVRDVRDEESRKPASESPAASTYSNQR